MTDFGGVGSVARFLLLEEALGGLDRLALVGVLGVANVLLTFAEASVSGTVIVEPAGLRATFERPKTPSSDWSEDLAGLLADVDGPGVGLSRAIGKGLRRCSGSAVVSV